MMNNPQNKNGISPVIGIVLLVGLTVGLTIFASTILFSSPEDSSYAVQQGEISTDGNQLILIDKGDMEKIYIKNDAGEIVNEITRVGQLVDKPESSYTAVGITSAGSEQIMRLG